MIDIQVRPYTRKEAETATEQFIQTGCAMRHMLLDLYERKAHTALGYGDDFEQYVHQRLGVTWKADYLRQVQMWARVERDVSKSDTPRTLPQNIAYELAKLPGEKRAGAYEEALALSGSGKGGLPDVKHIVTRLLNGGTPAPTAPPKTAVPPPVKTPEPEPEVPVGAVVDVRTGRPVEEVAPTEPERPRVVVSTFTPAPAPERIDEPSITLSEADEVLEPDPFSVETDGGPIHDEELGFLPDEAHRQLRQFRLYWSLGSDIETVAKALGALHVIYSHKPAFQRHAPDYTE